MRLWNFRCIANAIHQIFLLPSFGIMVVHNYGYKNMVSNSAQAMSNFKFPNYANWERKEGTEFRMDKRKDK